MPLVNNKGLPSMERLGREGLTVISREKAENQDIRELHIGLLNMMPDAALAATERQFFRLVGASNPIAQFIVHPFTLDGLPRGEQAKAHIAEYYEDFAQVREAGLDALIITGANVSGKHLPDEPFWEPLGEVIEWAAKHVTSTLCSCLATHAVLESRYAQRRVLQRRKIWGVFQHRVIESEHPLVADVNTRFDVPHSRWNEVGRGQFDAAGLRVLVESEDVGVHLATSGDGLRFVFFQGHPEYDTISLLKEYKREVGLWYTDQRADYPPFPSNYLDQQAQAMLNEHRIRVEASQAAGKTALAHFPEQRLLSSLDNTWRDTAHAVVSNWIGTVYQVTNTDRRVPFMSGIDPEDPLGLNAT